MVLVISGAALFTFTNAANFFSSSDPESGSLAGPAAIVSDSGAIGGKAVKFDAAATLPTTPPPSTGGSTGSCPAWPSLPTNSCVGVPSGYSLVASGSISASASQKIDGKKITGNVTLNGDNVAITNSRITGIIMANGHKGLTLTNVDLGPDSCPGSSSGTQIIHDTGGFTLKNTRVHNNPDDLLRVGGGTFLIQDSIVNGGCFYSGDHLDAIQFYDPGSVGKITIIHSIIDVKPVNNADSGNAAIFFADHPGSGTLLTMYNNKFNGGQVTTALYDALKGSGVVYDVHDNVYTNSASCHYGTGPISIKFDGTSGVKFTNNKYENGSTITCGGS